MEDHSRGNEGHGYTFGLSPQFLESLNITGPLHNRIFVANLDYKVDEMLSSRTSAGVRRLQEKLSKQLYWQL